MILENLWLAGSMERVRIRILGSRIDAVAREGELLGEQPGEPRISLNDCLVFPGLINSHDHLDFNSFPMMGNRAYQNYMEWGPDIHLQNKDLIRHVLSIPAPLRIRWGLYKNLLNGVTTVLHHGHRLRVPGDLVRVHQKPYSLHSVGLEKRWKFRINLPRLSKQPFVIHIGEGTDRTAREEINTLISWNLLKKKIIGIHAVAMDEVQAAAFQALVWCPASNFFLLHQTADMARLQNRTRILFGTDSTVSAPWNLWEHLRMARGLAMLDDPTLFDSVTRSPATVWGFPDRGQIRAGAAADLVIAAPPPTMHDWDSFYALDPWDIQLVFCQGRVQLITRAWKKKATQVNESLDGCSLIRQNGREQYIRGDLPGLLNRIRSYYPSASFPVSAVW